MFAITERLLLRPGWIEDAPALAEAIANKGIVTKLERAPWPYQLHDAEAFLGGARDPRYPELLIFARTRAAPRLIGGIGLRHSEEDAAELGYWIARPYWGLGFATEAGRAVIGMARESLRLPKLFAVHGIDNPASGRVLAKLGFRPTGRTVIRYSLARHALVQCVEHEQMAELAMIEPALAA